MKRKFKFTSDLHNRRKSRRRENETGDCLCCLCEILVSDGMGFSLNGSGMRMKRKYQFNNSSKLLKKRSTRKDDNTILVETINKPQHNKPQHRKR